MTVAVIIAAYNVASVVSRAIESVLFQTVPPQEIIVVDDGSTDDTRAVVRSLSRTYPQIELIALDVNRGPSHARNVAIEAAKCKWVAILDADDAWKPDRLRRLLQIAESERADFIADNQILYDAVSEQEGRRGFAADWQYQILDPEKLFRNDTLDVAEVTYPPLKPLVRREFLNMTGIRYDESSRYGEDFKFNAEILFSGARAILISEPLYIYSTRVGEFSGQMSPHSKSVPRFDLLVKMSDDLAEKYRAGITLAIDAAIQRRRTQLHLIHLANVARGFRREGNYLRYALFVLKHFDLVGFLLRRIARGATSRFSGR